jgi:PIN domain nuclease of toxin-antitoxin system
MPALLLDTCALIFIADDRPIRQSARQQVIAAGVGDGVFVSPVSAWEIGLLAAKKAIGFDPDPKTWFSSFLAYPGVRITPLTPEIAIDSCFLPSPPELHADPADRLLIATARAVGIPILTRDRRILDYGAAGLVGAIPC